MVSAKPTVPSVAPKLPEGWQAIWDSDEHDWYFYHPRSKQSQWTVPGREDNDLEVRGCGLFSSLFKRKTPKKIEKDALPSARTLDAIAKMDRDHNDEEIAMVLQHEEFSQDLSGRQHSFDNDWVDTTNYYAKQHEEAAAGSSSTPAARPIRASMISGASHAVIEEGDAHPSGDKPECGICMDDDDWRASWTWLECAHQFHTNCIEGWLKTAPRCPVCNTACSITR